MKTHMKTQRNHFLIGLALIAAALAGFSACKDAGNWEDL
jgi:hypothetical protein